VEWASEAGFDVKVSPSVDTLDEPWLVLTHGQGQIFFETAAFSTDASQTVVRVYAYPTLRQVRLVGPMGGAWEFRSTQNIPFRVQWNAAGFSSMMSDLLQ
jgi:hypothetical protein